MSDARLAAFLLALALLARAISLLTCGIYGTDGSQMLFMVDLISEGRWAEACGFTYHPGYPAIAALAKPLFGGAERAALWVSLLLGGGGVLPLFYAARDGFGRLPAFFAALAYAFHPLLIDLQSDVMTEGSFVFFLCCCGFTTQQAVKRGSVGLSVLSGVLGAASYLVRPEGLAAVALAAAWPLIPLAWNRKGAGRRLAGTGLALAAALLVAFPFLSWVKSVKGRWSLSAKASVAQGLSEEGLASREGVGARYAKLAGGFLKVTGPLLPFLALGAWALRGRGGVEAAVWLSFPAAHLAGLLYAFRTHPWVSHRYVVPLMVMGLAVAGLGLAVSVEAIRKRGPSWAGVVLVLAVVVLPSVRGLKPERKELGALRTAGPWIRSAAMPGDVVYSTRDQLAYLSGCKGTWMPERLEEALAAFRSGRVRWLAYTEEDLGRKPPYLDELRRDPILEPAKVFPGVRGGAAVYVHRVR